MPGCVSPQPIASRANERSTRAKSLQVKPATGIPCATVLSVSFVLSSAIGLF